MITGIVKIYTNGTLHANMPDASLDLGGKEREAVVGHSVYGPKEKIVPAVCTFSLAHNSDTKLADVKDIVGATLRFECDSGPVYTVANAFVAKPPSLKGGDGTVEIEMHGEPADEE